MIVAGDVGGDPAAETGAPNVDPAGVALRLGLQPMHDVEQIFNIGMRVPDFPQLDDFGGEAIAEPLGRRGPCENHAAIALAPAAIVEHHDKVSGLGEFRGLAAKALHGAAPAIGHDDGRQLAGGTLRRIEVGGKPRPFAPDRCLANVDLVRKRKGRLFAHSWCLLGGCRSRDCSEQDRDGTRRLNRDFIGLLLDLFHAAPAARCPVARWRVIVPQTPARGSAAGHE